MSWIFLIIAGLLEIVWVVCLKSTEGFTRLWPTLLAALAFTTSVIFLGFASKHLPIGTTYAVWTGIGAMGAVICGMVFLGEPVSVMRLVCAAMILGGVIGLKVSS